jgi:hypothetical protein
MAADLILCPACLERIIPLDAEGCECGECPICAVWDLELSEEEARSHQHTPEQRAEVRRHYLVAPGREEEVRREIEIARRPIRHLLGTVVSLVLMTIEIFVVAGMAFWLLFPSFKELMVGSILMVACMLLRGVNTYLVVYSLFVPGIKVGERYIA